MSQSQLLYKLQEIDLNILQRQKRLNDIIRMMNEQDTVKQAQLAVETATQAVRPHETKAKDLDLQLQSVRSKRVGTEQRLYSGAVKNPKELNDMQNELDSLDRRIKTLDSDLLEALLYLDDAQDTLKQAKTSLDAITQEWEHNNQALLQEKQILEKEVAVYKTQREEALKPITPASLQTYTTLRPQKANQPIALLKGSTCGVCGIEQTSTLVQAASKGDALVSCQSCRRILVVLGG
jgi:uncharacterized protein